MPPLDEISLNRLRSCDGSYSSDGCDGLDSFDVCDGHCDDYYGYMRLRQPNDTSTGHVRDEYESSLAGVWVSIMSTTSEELGSTPSEEFGSTSASAG
jgi:hypothetical protein